MLSSHQGGKCAKCRASCQKKDRSFHRFPKPVGKYIARSRAWAQWAYPEENWDSVESLMTLYKKCRLVCSEHFDRNLDFTENINCYLKKSAVPRDFPNKNYIGIHLMEDNGKITNSSSAFENFVLSTKHKYSNEITYSSLPKHTSMCSSHPTSAALTPKGHDACASTCACPHPTSSTLPTQQIAGLPSDIHTNRINCTGNQQNLSASYTQQVGAVKMEITEHEDTSDEEQIENHEALENDTCDTNYDTNRIYVRFQKQDQKKEKKTVSTKKSLQKTKMTTQSNALDELEQINREITNRIVSPEEEECEMIVNRIALQLRQLSLHELVDAQNDIQKILARYHKRNVFSNDVSEPFQRQSSDFPQSSSS